MLRSNYKISCSEGNKKPRTSTSLSDRGFDILL